jgi:hypothetical protein
MEITTTAVCLCMSLCLFLLQVSPCPCCLTVQHFLRYSTANIFLIWTHGSVYGFASLFFCLFACCEFFQLLDLLMFLNFESMLMSSLIFSILYTESFVYNRGIFDILTFSLFILFNNKVFFFFF